MPEETTPPEGGGQTTFTPPSSQDELNRIIEQRLARERAKFADYDDVKTKASKFDELEAATKSELQKAQDAIAERDSKIADLPKQVRGQVLRFASVASTKGFLDPEDALAFIDPSIDLSDTEAVSTALDELAERKPHLVRAPAKKLPAKPKPSGGDGGDGGGESPKGKERAAAALRQFRNT